MASISLSWSLAQKGICEVGGRSEDDGGVKGRGPCGRDRVSGQKKLSGTEAPSIQIEANDAQ